MPVRLRALALFSVYFYFVRNGSRREKVVKDDSNFPNYVEVLLKGFIRGKVATAN